MSIQQLSLQPAVVIAPDAPASAALSIMLERKVNHVAVCDAGRFLGLVGITDVLKQLIPASVRQPDAVMDLHFAGDAARLLAGNLRKLEDIDAAHLMQSVTPLAEDCPLLEAALELYRSVGPLPVVDAAGHLKGMLSRRVFIEALTRLEGAQHA